MSIVDIVPIVDKVLDLIREKPEYEAYFRRMVEYEKEHEKDEYFHDLGWEHDEVRVPGYVLYRLFIPGVLRRVYSSRSTKGYLLTSREATEKALEILEQPIEEEDVEAPPDLFSVIVGYEDIKKIMKKSLESEKPVPILLVGPVATAKSLFLEELNRIKGSSYHLGSSSTKAGLTQFLIDMRPQILLIDELDKMNRQDYAALLSLMESGKVVETKYGRRREEYMKVWVFGVCNTTKGIPPENLSRFHFVFRLREYTKEDYVKVVYKTLTEREDMDPEIAGYIAEKLSSYTKDVRKAVGFARICRTREEVDELLDTMKKYKGLER